MVIPSPPHWDSPCNKNPGGKYFTKHWSFGSFQYFPHKYFVGSIKDMRNVHAKMFKVFYSSHEFLISIIFELLHSFSSNFEISFRNSNNFSFQIRTRFHSSESAPVLNTGAKPPRGMLSPCHLPVNLFLFDCLFVRVCSPKTVDSPPQTQIPCLPGCMMFHCVWYTQHMHQIKLGSGELHFINCYALQCTCRVHVIR